MNIYFNIENSLILTYIISVVSCAYLSILNDTLRNRLSPDNLALCFIMSLVPVLNTFFAVFNAVHNIVLTSGKKYQQ